MRRLLLLGPPLLLVACASASAGEPDAGAGLDAPAGADAPPAADAAPITDATPDAARSMTLTQANSTVATAGSVACSNSAGTAENSYYRAFKLADHGITGAFEVTAVDFAIETATAGGGAASQPGLVKVYSYAGVVGSTLTTASLTLLDAANIQIGNGSTSMTVPITATLPAGSTMVIELFVPDGESVGNQFYIGITGAGESKPGYSRAPACGASAPTSWDSLGQTAQDMILSVTGTI